MKKALALILLVALCFTLVACSRAKDEGLPGTWTGNWEYNGNLIKKTFTLNEDGTYSSVLYRNGELNTRETGTYEADASEVRLYPNGGTSSWTAYDYMDGTLVNNGHVFTKK